MDHVSRNVTVAPVNRLEREIVANAQLIRHLGPTGTFDMIRVGWPVYDSLMALAIYRDGKPYHVSSVLAYELGHRSRVDGLDEILPAKEELFDWADGRFGEDSIPHSHSCGLWECVWLGEVDFPVPISAMSDVEFAAYPTGLRDKATLARAAGSGCFNSHTKWLAVSDKSGPIEVAFELSELLGYGPRDHRWIPDSWRTERAPSGYSWGFETVVAEDGAPVTLRYYSFRLKNASVYLARVWMKDRCDLSNLKVQIGQNVNQ